MPPHLPTPNSKQLSELSTGDLVEEVHLGRTNAWNEVYRRYRVYLLVSVRTRLGFDTQTILSSEDLLQSALLAAWKRIDSFEYRGEGSFRRWLRQIIINCARDRLRQRAHDPTPLSSIVSPVDVAADTPSGLVARLEEDARLIEALVQLPERDHSTIVMRDFEGKTWSDISRIAGVAPSTLRGRYRRGIARLTQLLENG